MSTKKPAEKKLAVKNYVVLDYEDGSFSDINGPLTYEEAVNYASDHVHGVRSFIAKVEAESIPEDQEGALIGIPRLTKKQLAKKG